MFLWSQGEEVEKWETLNFSLCTLVKNFLKPESATGVRTHTHTCLYIPKDAQAWGQKVILKNCFDCFIYFTHIHLWQALILKQFC